MRNRVDYLEVIDGNGVDTVTPAFTHPQTGETVTGSALAYNASAAAVQAELDTIAEGQFKVSSPGTSKYYIEFEGPLVAARESNNLLNWSVSGCDIGPNSQIPLIPGGLSAAADPMPYDSALLPPVITAVTNGTNEAQNVAFGVAQGNVDDPTGGTFTLTFGAATTEAISYNATAAAVQAALEALVTIGAGNVTVVKNGQGDYDVTFVNDLGNRDVALMTASGASLTGSAGTDEVVVIDKGTATGGTFTLSFDGQTTGNIAYNATGATVETALEALSNIAPADLAVAGAAGGPWTVTWEADIVDNPADITADGTNLTGADSPYDFSGANKGSVTVNPQGTDGGQPYAVDVAESTAGVKGAVTYVEAPSGDVVDLRVEDVNGDVVYNVEDAASPVTITPSVTPAVGAGKVYLTTCGVNEGTFNDAAGVSHSNRTRGQTAEAAITFA
jgi:hypothetical protein